MRNIFVAAVILLSQIAMPVTGVDSSWAKQVNKSCLNKAKNVKNKQVAACRSLKTKAARTKCVHTANKSYNNAAKKC